MEQMTPLVKASDIEPLELFDANCRVGRSDLDVDGAPSDSGSLLREMDRVGVREALVYHSSAAAYAPSFGNGLLAGELRGESRLHGCWVVMPHYTGEVEQPELLVRNLLDKGIRAVRMFPRLHRFSLADWSADELLGALAESRVPLFLDFGRSHWAEDVVDWNQVARVCRSFPALPVILVREGIGSARYLYPLLGQGENLRLEISYYQPSDGLADICARFGPQRLLFGTGLPEYAAGPPIAMLHYADVSAEDKRLIAGGNLRRMLAAVATEAPRS